MKYHNKSRYWRQRKNYLHSGFVDYVDQLVKQEAEARSGAETH